MTSPANAPAPPDPHEELRRLNDIVDQHQETINDLRAEHGRQVNAEHDAFNATEAAFGEQAEHHFDAAREALGSLSLGASWIDHHDLPGVATVKNTEHKELQGLMGPPGLKASAKYRRNRARRYAQAPQRSAGAHHTTFEDHSMVAGLRAKTTRAVHAIRNRLNIDHPFVQQTKNRSPQHGIEHHSRVDELTRDEAAALTAGQIGAHLDRSRGLITNDQYQHNSSPDVVELAPIRNEALTTFENAYYRATGNPSPMPEEGNALVAREYFRDQIGLLTNDGTTDNGYGFLDDTYDMMNGIEAEAPERRQAREEELAQVEHDLAQARVTLQTEYPTYDGWNLDSFTAQDFQRFGAMIGEWKAIRRQLALGNSPDAAQARQQQQDLETAVRDLIGDDYFTLHYRANPDPSVAHMPSDEEKRLTDHLFDVADLDSRREELRIMLGKINPATGREERPEEALTLQTIPMPDGSTVVEHNTVHLGVAEAAADAARDFIGLTALRSSLGKLVVDRPKDLPSGEGKYSDFDIKHRGQELHEAKVELEKKLQVRGVGIDLMAPSMIQQYQNLVQYEQKLAALNASGAPLQGMQLKAAQNAQRVIDYANTNLGIGDAADRTAIDEIYRDMSNVQNGRLAIQTAQSVAAGAANVLAGAHNNYLMTQSTLQQAEQALTSAQTALTNAQDALSNATTDAERNAAQSALVAAATNVGMAQPQVAAATNNNMQAEADYNAADAGHTHALTQHTNAVNAVNFAQASLQNNMGNRDQGQTQIMTDISRLNQEIAEEDKRVSELYAGSQPLFAEQQDELAERVMSNSNSNEVLAGEIYDHTEEGNTQAQGRLNAVEAQARINGRIVQENQALRDAEDDVRRHRATHGI